MKEKEDEQHFHVWEESRWGVILGVTKCKLCGKIATEKDFK